MYFDGVGFGGMPRLFGAKRNSNFRGLIFKFNSWKTLGEDREGRGQHSYGNRNKSKHACWLSMLYRTKDLKVPNFQEVCSDRRYIHN